MSPVLPFDIIALIIDIIGENNDSDANFLKELALVSHSFLQMCRKHLFATVELHDADPICHVASSKKGFVKLLESRPEIVKYIRKLTYTIDYDHVLSPQFSLDLNFDNDDNLLSPILPNFLRTISHLNSLKINASLLVWNDMNPSLTSAFLHLMHLPTINHIDLSFIYNFPLSSLTPCVNLLRLDMSRLRSSDGDGSPEFVVQSEILPKIREFRSSDTSLLTTKLINAKMQDGRPAFNFMDLRRLSMSCLWYKDFENIRYILQNATVLEKLQLYIGYQSLVGLRDVLSLSARTLKVFDLSVLSNPLTALTDLRDDLEVMAGLESLSLKVQVEGDEAGDVVGSIFQRVEEVLVNPGWSALRQVSFKVEIMPGGDSASLSAALQTLPDKYLSHLPKHESFAFNFSAYVYRPWTSRGEGDVNIWI